MQVFLPYRDFDLSVRSLDNKRLNKQLLECAQMMRALAKGPDYKVYPARHPVTRAFRGHEWLMFEYSTFVVSELERRGIEFKKNWHAIVKAFAEGNYSPDVRYPVWLTDPTLFGRMQATHRASLYAKDPEHYAEFAGTALAPGAVCCTTHAPYFYPVHEGYENT